MSSCTDALGSYPKNPLEAEPSPSELFTLPNFRLGAGKRDKLYDYNEGSSHRKVDMASGNTEADPNCISGSQGSSSNQGMRTE